MAKSMTERMNNWRKKKFLGGGKSLTVMLEPGSVKILEELKERCQESNAKVIAKALASLQNSFTCKQEKQSDSFTCTINHPPSEAATLSSVGGVYLLLQDIKEKINQGAAVMALKEELTTAMKEMRGMGYDSSQIADKLYEAQIKTSKGNARWEGGTIRKWWK
jgi:hypothetical protein